MPTHWTYDDIDKGSELEQGDLIKPCPDVRAILEKYHRYFADDKYTLFLVSTQSCDLVRRRGEPKASYITLAAVRPFREVSARLVDEVVPRVGEGMFRRSGQTRWREFLARLLNQNEQALGLFYLHKDSDAGVDDESVAFLRVTVAFKAEHYDTIVAARVGRLRADFRAKLGWLLGNLFARPATPDWNDTPEDAALIKELIRDNIDIPGCNWIDDDIVNSAQSQGVKLEGKTEAELENLRPTPPLDAAIDEVIRQVRGAAGKMLRTRPSPVVSDPTTASPNATPESMDELLETLRKRLRSSQKFKSLFAN